MFSLNVRTSLQTTPGNDVEFNLADAAHSGHRQVDMPCPWATGDINYTTTPSPAGSAGEMSGIRGHNIGVSDAVTTAIPGNGTADIASSYPGDVGSSLALPQPMTSVDATQLPTYRFTSSLLNPTCPDQ
ncbi:hypothetical protein BKA70DRAFT_1225971 [Coprinopsis sp. MPI-PUGE-AT-0042]|nr:hypothetical protein BKA70DRAFT_1225971 [Coprinopsis sp. MPI-PUGE-AT-0042]